MLINLISKSEKFITGLVLMKKHKYSALYRYIQELHGDHPWGSMLDAGTGANSIRWMSELPTQRWTAVTGSRPHAQLSIEAAGTAMRSQDKIVVGNWADKQFMPGEMYDTVIADYLLGAIEGFSPYFQSYLFPRLHSLTRHKLYVTGLEPYVPISKPDTHAGQLLWEIGRFRDACVLLKGGMPYREYPLPWVIDQLNLAGFKVCSTKQFNIRYKDLFVNAQINMAITGLDSLEDNVLVKALNHRAESLRSAAQKLIKQQGALGLCRNYVVAAEPIRN